MQRPLEILWQKKKKNKQFQELLPKGREKNRSFKTSGASADDVYTPVLWYYDLLLFLKDQETPRSSRSNVDEVSKEIFCSIFIF